MQHVLLIMLTSFAPSPIASVTVCLLCLTSSTTCAFCRGVTRQQTTAWHMQHVSSSSNSICFVSACSCRTHHQSSQLHEKNWKLQTVAERARVSPAIATQGILTPDALPVATLHQLSVTKLFWSQPLMSGTVFCSTSCQHSTITGHLRSHLRRCFAWLYPLLSCPRSDMSLRTQ